MKLELQVEPNVYEEHLTCLICGRPRYVYDTPLDGITATTEYLVTLRRPGETAVVGLHHECARRNGLVS